MPKKTVRITNPTGYVNDLTHLIERVWQQHVTLGASSPFAASSIIDMTKYEALMTEALEKRARAIELHAEAEALMGESRNLLGIGAGQKIHTEGTLYNLLNKIKHLLLIKHSGVEEDLSPWGFNVVIGSSSVGAKKKKKV